MKIPSHIAFIMDGNGRYAKQRMLPRSYGHKVGADTLENLLEICDDLGIRYITAYAFSTENWKRPKEEVNQLMLLFEKYLLTSTKKAMKNNIKILIIGDKTILSSKLQKTIKETENITKNNNGLTFIIAINYGGRDEIIRAIKKMNNDKIDFNLLNENIFNSYLDTSDIPDPDLLIRTGGEYRLSNFLLWQLSYTEFYFTDCLWPDFDKKELLKAIEYYSSKDRRYGGIKNV